VVHRQHLLGEAEKDKFLRLLREYEIFCGVSVLTSIILDNHFHLVVAVPKAPQTPLTDEELLARIEALSGTAGSKATRQQLTWFRERNQHEQAEALRRRYLVRMHDISQFMKTLEGRFTQWFNKKHKRDGHLWQSRFKSVLVEGEGDALATVGAYVDLNSVRASIADDPMQYKWSGYGQAIAGDKRAREGIRRLMAAALRVAPESLSLTQAMRQYRVWLYVQGEQNEGTDERGQPIRKGFTPEQVLEVILRKGRVPPNEFVKLRVRYFVDGLVLGSREFVNQVFSALRSRFGPKRKDGARRMLGLESKLYVLRDLKRNLIGVTGQTVPGNAGAASGRSNPGGATGLPSG
jgi:REP element-mobilizing transposase RayT